ncbi:MAG: hypothetical protein ACRDK9_11085, partial [Solirubrobacterales bacterium]
PEGGAGAPPLGPLGRPLLGGALRAGLAGGARAFELSDGLRTQSNLRGLGLADRLGRRLLAGGLVRGLRLDITTARRFLGFASGSGGVCVTLLSLSGPGGLGLRLLLCLGLLGLGLLGLLFVLVCLFFGHVA